MRFISAELILFALAILLLDLTVCCFDGIIEKDGTLNGLAMLINDRSNVNLYSNWTGSLEDTESFLDILEPYLLGFPMTKRGKEKTITKQRSTLTELNCNNPSYSSVLTGQPLKSRKSRRLIVDIVPFGYDVDKLLVRFHETYDVVDVYVIHEMTYTLLGLPKKKYFPALAEQERFKPFMNKVIYTFSNATDIEPVAALARKSVIRLKAKHKNTHGRDDEYKNVLETDNDDIWALNTYCKRDPIRTFLEIDEKNPQYHLKELIMKYINDASGNLDVYAIQNDADEIVSAKVIQHIKYCDIKTEVLSIYTPCFVFKGNFHWLQKTFDMSYFNSGISNSDAKWKIWIYQYWDSIWSEASAIKELNNFLWSAGPYIWPMNLMFTENPPGNLRGNMANNQHQQFHMGYGAAIHMSTVADPVETLMKSCGTIENMYSCSHIISPQFIKKALNGSITGNDIYKNTIKPWCHRKHIAKHNSDFSEESRRVISECIPLTVKTNPAYFPFMYPDANSNSNVLSGNSALKSWSDACPKHNGMK